MIHPIECGCGWCSQGRAIVARASRRECRAWSLWVHGWIVAVAVAGLALAALATFGAAVAVCR